MKSRRHARRSSARYRTHKGGARLGAGAQGTVYDLNGDESFLSSLPAGLPSSVSLYTYTDHARGPAPVRIRDPREIEELFAVLRRTRGAIAKVFKEKPEVRAVFFDEIVSNRGVLKVYGDEGAAQRFLTVLPLSGFGDHRMLGAIFQYVGEEPIYATFGKKCTAGRYAMNLPHLIRHILESLIILQRENYEHNDIKLDNIVLCDDRYRLVDWGEAGRQMRSADIADLRVGSPTTTSPIRWYCRGSYKYSYFVSPIGMMGWRLYLVDNPFRKSAPFQEQYTRIKSEYNRELVREPDRRALYEDHGATFGLFQLGMTALHAVFRYDLDYARFRPIIERLASLTDPFRDAQHALDELPRLLPA